jgi:hypothetical protein
MGRVIQSNDGTVGTEELGKYLGTSYMLKNKADFEPGRTSDFILKIKFTRDLYDMDGNLVATKEDASEALALSLRDYNGPEMTINTIQIRTGNGVMKYAGAPDIGDSSITFTDYIGQKTENILLAWYTMAHNPQNDKIGFKEYYAQDGILYKWAPNGTRQISWKLLGCWINTFSLGAFDRTNPDQRQISTNIIYDKAIPWEIPNYANWTVDSTVDKNAKPTTSGNNAYANSIGTNYIGTQGRPTNSQIAENLTIND